jgi:hypothetical protein
MNMNRLLITACILLLGCAHANADGASRKASHKVFTLALPRAMNENDLLRALITTGPLPRGARVVAKLPNGAVVGSIAPYSMTDPAPGGSHTIAIPARAVRDGAVTLHLHLVEKRGATPRAPSVREVEKVELLLVPSR